MAIQIYSDLEGKDVMAKGITVEEKYTDYFRPVGTWVDGRQIWRKTVQVGALPDTSTLTVNNDLSSYQDIISYKGISKTGDGSSYITLPFAATTPEKCVQLAMSKRNIFITTGTDRSNYVSTYITFDVTMPGASRSVSMANNSGNNVGGMLFISSGIQDWSSSTVASGYTEELQQYNMLISPQAECSFTVKLDFVEVIQTLVLQSGQSVSIILICPKANSDWELTYDSSSNMYNFVETTGNVTASDIIGIYSTNA